METKQKKSNWLNYDKTGGCPSNDAHKYLVEEVIKNKFACSTHRIKPETYDGQTRLLIRGGEFKFVAAKENNVMFNQRLDFS